MIFLFRPIKNAALATLLLAFPLIAGCAGQGATAPSSTASPATAYTELGFAYLQRDDAGRAQQAFERAADLDPDDPGALHGLALIHQRQGESEIAERYFQRALGAGDGATRVRNNYAAFLFDQGRIAPACEQLDIASRDLRYERRAQLFANLGQCRHRLGEQQAAIEALERAVQLDPRQARAWRELTEIRIQRQQPESARTALRRYVRLVGESDESRRLARSLDALERRPR